MHPVTLRLYEAVQQLVRATELPPPTRVANEANITPQTLKNWETRGPSAQGLLDFQLAHGVNATWLLTGHGPFLVGARTAGERPATYSAWPLSGELLARLSQLDADTRRRLENGVRGHLDMPPLSSTGNSAAA